MSFKDIGIKIQMAREEKGINQEQLARALGCSQPALSNYEKGKRRLYLSHLEKLSEILDKPLEYFMENNGQPKTEEETQAVHPGFNELMHAIQQLGDKEYAELCNYIEFLKWKAQRRRC